MNQPKTIAFIAEQRGIKPASFRVSINRWIKQGRIAPGFAAVLDNITSYQELPQEFEAAIMAALNSSKSRQQQDKPAGPSVDDLEAEIAELQARLESCQDNIGKSADAMRSMLTQIDDLKEDRKHITQSLESKQQLVSSLRLQIDQLQRDIASEKKESATWKSHAANQRSIIEKEQQAYLELHNNNQALSATVSALTSELDILKAENARRQADIGKMILSSPNVRFAAAMVPIIGQAIIFALLFCKVYNIEVSALHVTPIVIVGVLFEAVGLMIALSTDNKKGFTMGGDFVSYRGLWLTAFFVLQILIDFAYVGMFSASATEWIGKILIGVSFPLAVLAYNNLYLKE